jgi:hypothetical protein
MSVSTQYSVLEYDGAAGTGPYQITWPFDEETDVYVQKRLAGTSAWIDLANPADYTISSSEVTLDSSASAGDTIRIYRETARVQPIDFVDGQRLVANSLEERGFDRLVLMAQEIKDTFDEIQTLEGIPGDPGVSVNWLGALASAPGSPNTNDGYYNTVDNIAYVWDGDSWEIVAPSIRWRGESATPPGTPRELDVYFDTSDGTNYIYTGSDWEVFVASTPGRATWNAAVSYSTGDVVFYDVSWYISLEDSNVGNQPDSSPTEWEALLSSFEYDANYVYAANDVAWYDGAFYNSKVGSNSGNQPDTSTTQWKKIPANPTWDDEVEYASGEIVFYSGWFYSSKQNANLNQEPGVATGYWRRLPKDASYDSGVTYDDGQTVYYETDDRWYVSLQNDNIAQTPGSAPTYWSPLPKLTVSTNGPSGGQSGDIWFEY